MFVVPLQLPFITILPQWWFYTEAIAIPVIIFSYSILSIIVNHSYVPCRSVRSVSDWYLYISIICSKNSCAFFIKGKEGQKSEWRS